MQTCTMCLARNIIPVAICSKRVASKVADSEIEANKRNFEHDGAVIMNENPLLCKFRYIESRGLKREWEQTERKELHGSAPLKKMAQLDEAKAFMECLGAPGRHTLATARACAHVNTRACFAHVAIHVTWM